MGVGRRKRTLVQYDYRHPADGELFSCVKPTLDECRTARDKWLTTKKGKGGKLMNAAGYQTLIVKFSEPIKVLDSIFDDAEAWGNGHAERVDRQLRGKQVYRH